MTINEVADAIRQKGSRGRPVLIGVEGFGGSGKSTIAQKLAEALDDAYVIGIDDFIVKENIAEPSWDRGVWDRNRLEEQVLRPVSAGKPARYQKLIWTTNTLSEPIEIPEVGYLIIEGITAYHADVARYYDYKIWVDVPLEVAEARGRRRAGEGENAAHWDLWAANDRAYRQQHHPEQHADFTISNL